MTYKISSRVRTTKANYDEDWTSEALASRQWGYVGTIVASHNAHGFTYEVRHDNGKGIGHYAPDELEPYEDELSWNNVYLLGWYDHAERAYLTSWHDEVIMSYVNVIVIGATPLNMPLWSANVPSGVRLVRVPEGKNPQEYAKELGGYYAFGWLMLKGIKRPASRATVYTI